MIDTLLDRHTVIFISVLAAAFVVAGTGVGAIQKPGAKRLSAVCIRIGYVFFGASVLLFIGTAVR